MIVCFVCLSPTQLPPRSSVSFPALPRPTERHRNIFYSLSPFFSMIRSTFSNSLPLYFPPCLLRDERTRERRVRRRDLHSILGGGAAAKNTVKERKKDKKSLWSVGKVVKIYRYRGHPVLRGRRGRAAVKPRGRRSERRARPAAQRDPAAATHGRRRPPRLSLDWKFRAN